VLNGYATRELADAAREFAWRNRISIAELIRRAVAFYLKRGKP